MAREIEPGCLVMVINHPEAINNGKSFTAVSVAGKGTKISASNDFYTVEGFVDSAPGGWFLSESIAAGDFSDGKHGVVFSHFCSSSFLIRIDGFEDFEVVGIDADIDVKELV